MQEPESPRRRRVLAGISAGVVATSLGMTTAAAQEGTATVEFSDQSTDGTTVVVDSTSLPEGGFITIHDSSLADGDAIGSVRGTSEYLESGDHEGIEVELDDPLVEDDTLIAMPHRDTNDNQTYDFVDAEGEEDGPYTADGGPVTDDAAVQVEGDAAVLMSDQETAGQSVTVDFVRMADGGFVTIHDSSLLDGETIPSVVGVSDYLEAGTNEDIEIQLDEELTEDDTLIAMPHRDSNDNETYDFVETEGQEDGPYTTEEGAVTNSASVTVADDGMDDGEMDDSGNETTDDGTADNETDDGTMDDGTMDNETTDDNESDDESADDGGPGFGPIAGVAGLGGLATYAYRRLNLDSEPPAPADDDLDEKAEK
ncbi:DUF7282 domain-containing protein [Halovenus amylolytica]|uniref:DUF7282 domain-containing protein n=1 Tax=Halovenus amylolytica TaxID=2500550 RepID=UPI0036124CF8